LRGGLRRRMLLRRLGIRDDGVVDAPSCCMCVLSGTVCTTGLTV
jgi:hypothetical protein